MKPEYANRALLEQLLIELGASLLQLSLLCKEISGKGYATPTDLRFIEQAHSELSGRAAAILKNYAAGDEVLAALVERRLFEIGLAECLGKAGISSTICHI